MERTPKSMVIRMGASDVGPSVTQLVKDMRSVMEPHTASRLKVCRQAHVVMVGLTTFRKGDQIGFATTYQWLDP